MTNVPKNTPTIAGSAIFRPAYRGRNPSDLSRGRRRFLRRSTPTAFFVRLPRGRRRKRRKRQGHGSPGFGPNLWPESGDRTSVARGSTLTSWTMSEGLDLQAFVARFQKRAESVKNRPMPPVEGPERLRFREQQQTDFMDYAMIGDAEASLEDGILTLRIDLRPGKQ